MTGSICHAQTCIHKNDTTLCKSHGQEPEGQHEYSKEQDGVIEDKLTRVKLISAYLILIYGLVFLHHTIKVVRTLY